MQKIDISPQIAIEELKSGALLVDVREPEELKIFDFSNAEKLALPLSVFEEGFPELTNEKKLIMVCHEGVRSLRAAYYLLNNGFSDVVNLAGGLMAWYAAGLPTYVHPDYTVSTGGGCCGGGATESDLVDIDLTSDHCGCGSSGC